METMKVNALIVLVLCGSSIYSANAQDAINTQTGEVYPGAGAGGSINTSTGEYYPAAGAGGSINTNTGEYYPSTDGVNH